MSAHGSGQDSAHGYAPIGGRVLSPGLFLLANLVMIAFFLLALRFFNGIGAVAAVNDGVTWGIWVVVDVIIGTAFGCAGYAVALLVYVLNKGEYSPLMRSALMAGMFGYTLGGMAVMIDLGRYWNFYNLFLPWYAQPRSVMFEVAMCVTTYIIMLWLEFTPTFLERFGLHQARRWLSRVLFAVIALGVLLPTMHQSSLGTLLVVVGHRISPLYQTNLLPLLFLLSALLLGYAIVIFEAVFSAAGFRRPLETDILAKLSMVTWAVLAAFFVIRFADLLVRGTLGLAFTGSILAIMFWIEIACYALPLLLLATPAGRRDPQRMFVAAVLLLIAGVLYRIDAYLVAYQPATPGWHYFPSVPELLVTIGIFALEVIAYLVFIKLLPVLPALPAPRQQQPRALKRTAE